MLKLWNLFSDIVAKLKYFLNFTLGVELEEIVPFWKKKITKPSLMQGS